MNRNRNLDKKRMSNRKVFDCVTKIMLSGQFKKGKFCFTTSVVIGFIGWKIRERYLAFSTGGRRKSRLETVLCGKNGVSNKKERERKWGRK